MRHDQQTIEIREIVMPISDVRQRYQSVLDDMTDSEREAALAEIETLEHEYTRRICDAVDQQLQRLFMYGASAHVDLSDLPLPDGRRRNALSRR